MYPLEWQSELNGSELKSLRPMSPYEALLIAPDSKSVQYINTSHQIKKNDTGPLDSSYICFVIDQISNLYIFLLVLA